MDKPFIWLASYPKSGNTWMRVFLGSVMAKRPVALNHLPYGVCLSDQNPLAYQSVSPLALADLRKEAILQIRGAALVHMLGMARQPPVLIKTHWANATAVDVRVIPPALTAGAVYIMRDPRDVVLSLARHMAIDIDTAITFLLNDDAVTGASDGSALFTGLKSWATHVRSWRDAAFPVLVARYEDMVANPVAEFTDVLEFLNMDTDLVEQAVEWTAFETLKREEDAEGFFEARNGQFFGSGQVGRWRGVLTPEQVARIEDGLGDEMQQHGYRITRLAA